jgi:hypothetical protein
MPQSIIEDLFSVINPRPSRRQYQETHFDASRYFNIDFDPSVISTTTGESIYKDVFKAYEDQYKSITGLDIDLTKGKRNLRSFDRATDINMSSDYKTFKDEAARIGEENPYWATKLGESQKDAFGNYWASQTAGLIDYMGQNLPPKGTSEGDEMREAFGPIVSETIDKFITPMIKTNADMLGQFHSTDSKGDYGKAMLAAGEKVAGAGLMANDDLLAGLTKFLRKVDMNPTNDWEGNTEKIAEKIFKTGKFIEDRGTVRHEEVEPATGKFAQSFLDRGALKAFTDLDYMYYKGTQSAVSQAGTTGLGTIMSTAAQLHPTVRGMGLVARAGWGLLASTPSLALGYIFESGDAYSSARDYMDKLRQDAIDEKRGLSKKEWEAKKGEYLVALSENMSVTADLLQDNDIDSIASEIAKIYGLQSTGVEAAGTALTAGIAVRSGAKQLGILLGKKGAEKEIAWKMAAKFGKSVKTGVLTGMGSVVSEGATEALQEWMQEKLLSERLPKRDINIEQIWDAGFAGGVFGGGVSVSQSTYRTIKGLKQQKTTEQLTEEKMLKVADDIKSGKTVDIYDNYIIGAKLLGMSANEIAASVASGDGSQESRSIVNVIRGRFGALESEIGAIMDTPARAAGFLKEHKSELEDMGLVFNEKSLGNLMLQPSQIAEILGVKEADLSSDEIVPSKYPQHQQTTVDELNQKELEEEFSGRDDLESVIGGFDPTIADQSSAENPGLAVEQMIEMVERSAIEEIDKQVERLEDLTIDTHLGPLDRQAAINDLKKEKKDLLSKQKSAIPAAETSTDYESQRVKQELRPLAESRGISLKIVEDGKERFKRKAELIADLQKSDEAPTPITIREAAVNQAKNIVASTANLWEPGVVDVEALTDEAIFTPAGLLNHAKNLVIDTAPFMDGETLNDRNGLIQAILDKQGPIQEMHMGIGLPMFFKQKNKSILHQKFRQGWYQLMKEIPDIGSSEGLFRRWVEELAGPVLPDHIRAEFYDWANTFAPNKTLVGDIAYAMHDKFRKLQNLSGATSQAFESEVRDVETILVNSADYLKESILQQDTEGADIHTENFTHLNSGFFEAMGVVLKKDKIDQIVLAAKNALTYEEFIKNISTKEFDFASSEGLTAAEIVAEDSPLSRKLLQFFVSNLVENNSITNDGILGEGQFPDATASGKTVQLSINRTRKGWQNPLYTNQLKKDGTKKPRIPGFERPTMADRFLETPIVWLNGSNVTQSLPPVNGYFPRAPVYGFLTADDIKELTATRFHDKNLIPVFIKGDFDRIGLIEVTAAQKALDPEQYWAEERKQIGDVLADEYIGLELTDQEMIDMYGSVADYKAANIARHEAYKELLGDDYHELSAHKIMHRIKILFTPTTTRTGGRESTIKLIDLNDSVNGDGKLFTRTTWKSGETSEKNLVIFANGKNQYAGDGMTITSERVFLEKYPSEVGANPLAKRAKTVKVVRTFYDEKLGTKDGTLLMKHQEMTFNLPEDAQKSEIFNGVEKVAEIRREKGQVNIYVEDRNGNYTKYIDHLATTDEAKVFLGEFNDFSKIHSLPSEATGHIQFTEADKQKAPFPMQVTNYLHSPEFLTELMKLMENPDMPGSAANVLMHMISVSQEPAYFDSFLKLTKEKHPDSMPRMIVEMARAGAGLHPTQLDYGQVLIKNRLFKQAMDVKQDGGVLDFRPNLVSNIDKGKIVLPFGHSIKETIARKLSEIKRVNKDFTQIMNMSREDLNELVKQNPIKVMLVRHPVPSRAGYRMLVVDSFENGIGDSFMINDEDVKEVFEGDFDHDTGHISVLPAGMTRQLVNNETFQDEMAALSLDEWAKDIEMPSIGSLEGAMELMGEMVFGKTAVGEISNVQRVAGMAQTRFESMEIDGKIVKVRRLKSMVLDPALGREMSVEQLLRHYAQAAFDNVSLRLLKKWDYSQEKLYKMLFFNADGTELTDVQYQVLSKSVIKTFKITQAIKKGEQKGKSLGLRDLMELSQDYTSFTEDPEGYLFDVLKGTRIDIGEGQKRDGSLLVGKIKMKDELHPHEKLAIMPIRYLNNQRVTLDNFFAIDDLKSKNAHMIAYRMISDEKQQLSYVMDALGVTTIEGLQQQDKNSILNQMESGNEFGAFMRQAMNDVYRTIEEDDSGSETKKIANSMTWDYNVDFVEFVDKWLDGFDREDGTHQKGYNELSEIEKVAATYTFLGGIHDTNDNINKINTRKLPPVSLRQGESLLHPAIMQNYFSVYNEIASDRGFNHERYDYIPHNNDFKKTLKEYMGCE